MNGTERKSKRQRNGESKLAQKKHRLHRKESKYKNWGHNELEDPVLRREHREHCPP
jgi:hypothetical protein